jgi:hypothetical protein
MTYKNLNDMQGGGIFTKLKQKFRNMRITKNIADIKVPYNYGKTENIEQIDRQTPTKRSRKTHKKKYKKSKYNHISILMEYTKQNTVPNHNKVDYDIVFSFSNLQGLKIIDFLLYTNVNEPDINTVMRYMGKTSSINSNTHSKKYKRVSAGLSYIKQSNKTQKRKMKNIITKMTFKNNSNRKKLNELKVQLEELEKQRNILSAQLATCVKTHCNDDI